MATPRETIWEAAPHTISKHAILRKYLDAWFGILGSTQGRILYLDGFAGPGEYKGGEPGSPFVALEAAAAHRKRFKGEVVFHFIEEDPERCEHLSRRLEAVADYREFTVVVECSDFASVITEVLDDLDGRGRRIAPTFAFIDPFGFKGLPMQLIHRLLDHPKTEAFINFNVNSINRFVSHPDRDIRSHVNDLFGTEVAKAILDHQANRFEKLRHLYQGQLEKQARFVRFFSMNDADDRPIYDLFFAGNHPLGHYRMKEAMWKVDPQAGIRFSDATDPDQQLLFETDPEPQLLRRLLKRFRGRSEVRVDEIKTWVRDDTAFLIPHLTDALRQGEGVHFAVRELHSDGSKRRAGSFKDVAIVDFTWLPPPEYVQGKLF